MFCMNESEDCMTQMDQSAERNRRVTSYTIVTRWGTFYHLGHIYLCAERVLTNSPGADGGEASASGVKAPEGGARVKQAKQEDANRGVCVVAKPNSEARGHTGYLTFARLIV
eukprot:3353348-Pyramimonas_sp.AAC.1